MKLIHLGDITETLYIKVTKNVCDMSFAAWIPGNL